MRPRETSEKKLPKIFYKWEKREKKTKTKVDQYRFWCVYLFHSNKYSFFAFDNKHHTIICRDRFLANRNKSTAKKNDNNETNKSKLNCGNGIWWRLRELGGESMEFRIRNSFFFLKNPIKRLETFLFFREWKENHKKFHFAREQQKKVFFYFLSTKWKEFLIQTNDPRRNNSFAFAEFPLGTWVSHSTRKFLTAKWSEHAFLRSNACRLKQ